MVDDFKDHNPLLEKKEPLKRNLMHPQSYEGLDDEESLIYDKAIKAEFSEKSANRIIVDILWSLAKCREANWDLTDY